MSEQLTDEQVENWRRVLCMLVGPYALFASREQIQAFCDKFQQDVETNSYCTCDPKRMGYTRHMDDTVTCNYCQKLRKIER